MPKIGDVTGDDLKKQQDEYYLLVTEVIGGISSDITDHDNRLLRAEATLLKLSKKLDELEKQNILLTKEIMTLRSGQSK